MRKTIRSGLVAFLVGALCVGLAWAGSGLVPISTEEDPLQSEDLKPGAQTPVGEGASEAVAPTALEPGFYAGAAKVSIEPRPDEYDGTWETDYDKCATLRGDEKFLQGLAEGATHVANFRVRWTENPNCLYMGGYGIGPVNPITNWQDPYGVWVRSVALSDGTDTLVLTIIDGAYYFGSYNSMCEGCGFFDLQQSLGQELGIDPSGFFFASSHSHTSPDFIGGWGGVPDWYMRQVKDALTQSVKEAVGSLRPAVLEAGEEFARPFNAERRDFYRSAEEQNLAWFRVVQPTTQESTDPKCKSPVQAEKPECQATTTYQGIATVGSFAAHPVTEDTESGTADADFPAVFAARTEERFGGVGLFFQTGLGNISPRGNKVELGTGLADLIPGDVNEDRVVEGPDVGSAQTFWDQPVTNSGLAALGVPGFFDRPFANTPAAVSAGKGGNKPCRSASPVSVNTAVSAAKVGSLLITGAPGEVFSNYTNTLKERNPGGVTMPLALVNDGLGYIIQSFETDHVGRQITGFVGEVVEYEDAYSIDACFGDKALEETIALIGNLR